MKINVALFITALSTTAASAAAGDDVTAVERPHLRALLQTNKLMACPAYLDGRTNSIEASLAEISCDGSYCAPCTQSSSTNQFSNCVQQTLQDGDAFYFVKGCCTSPNNMNNCNGQNEVEDFIKANDVEKEEEVPQDTTSTTKKLGDEIEEAAVVPSSSTLRASSLLKDSNVFTKQDGDETEDFLEVGTCGPSNHAPSDPCTASPRADYYLDCSGCSGKTNCVSFNSCSGDFCSGNTWSAKCCNSGGNNCNNGESGQADEEDAVMIKASEEEEVEVPQDTNKLDASSPLRASLLKVE